jgi:hypothetical protein
MKHKYFAILFAILSCASTSCDPSASSGGTNLTEVDVGDLRTELTAAWTEGMQNYTGKIELEMAGGARLSSNSDGVCEYLFDGIQYTGEWTPKGKKTARHYLGLSFGPQTTAPHDACMREVQEDATLDISAYSFTASIFLAFDEFVNDDLGIEVSVLSARRWEWSGYRLASIRYSAKSKDGLALAEVPLLHGLGSEVIFEAVFAENAPPGAYLWQISGRDVASGQTRVERSTLKIDGRELPEFSAP